MKDLLIQYCKYNLWANTKLCGFLDKLDPSLLDKELISSFNTIRKTAYHIYYAEKIWYKRLNGESLLYNKEELENIALHGSPIFAKSKIPHQAGEGLGEVSFSGFKKILLDQSQLFIDYAESLTEDQLLAGFDYKSTEGKPYRNKIWQSIHHCMNHSTFHRGQLITMLRNVGYTDLSSTDYITFIREAIDGEVSKH